MCGRQGAGIGKSTLLNLISGGLEAVCGHINRNSAVRMATYSQHHMDGLALHLSPLQYFVHEFKNEKDERLRAHLSNFGISGDLAMQPMSAPRHTPPSPACTSPGSGTGGLSVLPCVGSSALVPRE